MRRDSTFPLNGYLPHVKILLCRHGVCGHRSLRRRGPSRALGSQRHSCRAAARAMATYLHAREADAYARLLKERRRRPKAAPSFRFEPRAMPTIEERPVGLPPPGLRYTLLCAPPGRAAVDEQAAAAAEVRRRAAAAAAEDAAIRRYLAKQATAPRAPAPVPADAAAAAAAAEDARNLHQLMCAVDEEHAALARQSFREVRAGQPAQAADDTAAARRPPTRRRSSGDRPRGRPAGTKKSRRRVRRPPLLRPPAAPSRCSSTRGITGSSPRHHFSESPKSPAYPRTAWCQSFRASSRRRRRPCHRSRSTAASPRAGGETPRLPSIPGRGDASFVTAYFELSRTNLRLPAPPAPIQPQELPQGLCALPRAPADGESAGRAVCRGGGA